MLSTLREVTLSHLVAQRKKSRLLCVQDEEDNRPQAISLESNTLILLEEVHNTFAFILLPSTCIYCTGGCSVW